MPTIYIIKRSVSDYEYSYEENLYAVTDEEVATKDVAKLQEEANKNFELTTQVIERMQKLVLELGKDTERFGEHQDIFDIFGKSHKPKTREELSEEQKVLQKIVKHNHDRMIAINNAALEIVSKEMNLTAKNLEQIEFDQYMNPTNSTMADVTFNYEQIELFEN